jgi:hypothetical protein
MADAFRNAENGAAAGSLFGAFDQLTPSSSFENVAEVKIESSEQNAAEEKAAENGAVPPNNPPVVPNAVVLNVIDIENVATTIFCQTPPLPPITIDIDDEAMKANYQKANYQQPNYQRSFSRQDTAQTTNAAKYDDNRNRNRNNNNNHSNQSTVDSIGSNGGSLATEVSNLLKKEKIVTYGDVQKLEHEKEKL